MFKFLDKIVNLENASLMAMYAAISLIGVILGSTETVKSICGIGFILGVYFSVRAIEKRLTNK